MRRVWGSNYYFLECMVGVRMARAGLPAAGMVVAGETAGAGVHEFGVSAMSYVGFTNCGYRGRGVEALGACVCAAMHNFAVRPPHMKMHMQVNRQIP